MQNLFGKDSERRTSQSWAPWLASHSSCFNLTEPSLASLLKSGNTNLATAQEDCCHVKHSNSQSNDQDSSSTLSTGLSKCKAATAERRDSYTHHITSLPGCNGKHPEGCMRSYLSSGNADYTIHQLQHDFNQSMACTSYSGVNLYHGVPLAAYESKTNIYPQMVGITPARVPIPLGLAEDIPIYVNAKQYRGILRRRHIRAKLEAQNKLVKARKPYLHESRHLHALKRARGSGGRFLNVKNMEQPKPSCSTRGSNISHPQLGGNISSSDGRQSETGSWGTSTPSGSDVTSIFSGDDAFQQSEFRATEYPLHVGATMKRGGRFACNGT